MYYSLHNHSDHSNYRLADSMNKIEDLIKYAQELGMGGIALTDHETVGGHVKALHLLQELREKDPEKWNNFKLILGNEIYLCNRQQIQEEKEYVFPHFILLAKNARGNKALRELSTIAWIENSFTWVNMRVPTFYDNLESVMKDYKGDVIGSTACIGGALPKAILDAYKKNPSEPNLNLCIKWIEKMQGIFGKENFFLELQPSIQDEQAIVNKYLIKLSELTGAKYIITTDSHYLKKDDRKIHEAFLNAQEGDREVADFYATTYMMSEEEIHSYLDKIIGADAVNLGLCNTQIIGEMVEEYSLDKPLNIPYIPKNVEEPDEVLVNKYKAHIPLLDYFYHSSYDSDRHLVREILKCINDSSDDFENDKAYEAIQTCLDSIKLSSEKQNTPWSAYLLQTKDIVQTCWDAGTLVGCSRGSGCGFVLLYMLGITQVNPLKEEVQTFHWRFLNPERVSPLDIDIDIQGEMRNTVLSALADKYGGDRHVTRVQTLGTAKSKKAIAIACRGLGYPNEDGVYLGSFIKAERGILYTLSQTFYGDEENGLLPDTEFVKLMTKKYPDVWEVARRIEGLIVSVGSHAGGCIVAKEDIVDDIALMKTKSGDIITQCDLHDAEACSLIKWDILAIDALSKIHTEMNLLLKDKLIEWQGTLKATYEKYLGVYSIERHNDAIWDMIDQHKILSLFQFERQSGWQAIELGQPRCLEDMAALNSVMRLMAPDGGESPLERYSHFKKNIDLWYKEMDTYGLTKEEQEFIASFALKNYGLLPNQENFMQIVQAPEVGGFNLLWADRLRKSIAKKNPKQFVELQAEFYENAKEKMLSSKLCHYVWDILISMNKGYGFNTSHTLGYSIVALQEANLAYHYPIEYWNCANLINDSGGEDSMVRYGKIAAAVGRMRKEGIQIIPPYINEAEFDFKPDPINHRIVYGLKAISGIGTDVATVIEKNKPYTSVQDFYTKIKSSGVIFGEMAMIQLIKAGAFDELEDKPREEIMKEFIKSISKPLAKVNVNHIEDLVALGMITDEEKQKDLRYLRFRKWVYKEENIDKKLGKGPATYYYRLDHKFAEPYFLTEFAPDMEEGTDYQYSDDGTYLTVKRGKLDKVIDNKTKEFMTRITTESKYLDALNQKRFQQTWDDKVGSNNISRWEMNAMNYYYHEHELAEVNRKKYGVVNFDELPLEPEIAELRYMHGREVPRYALHKVIGTVIDKDPNHNTVTLLTPDGVVTVRFYAGQFTFYAREIAQKDATTGVKTVIDKSWFKRGTRLLVTGVRMGEQFLAKNYKDSIYKHSVQLIKDITNDGNLILISERASTDIEAEEAIGI